MGHASGGWYHRVHNLFTINDLQILYLSVLDSLLVERVSVTMRHFEEIVNCAVVVSHHAIVLSPGCKHCRNPRANTTEGITKLTAQVCQRNVSRHPYLELVR